MEATGRDLVDFWTFAAEKGLMNGNTAGGLRSACKEVLLAVEGDDWETADLRAIDVDEATQRFERLRMAKFKPTSLGVYKARFKNALQLYLTYLSDPSGWRYTAERPAKDRKKALKVHKQSGSGHNNGSVEREPDNEALEDVQMIDYPFPLRPGLIVRFRLPDDMTQREAERLGSHLKSLAYEAPKALAAGAASD